jgi:hypothetical protein
MPACLRACVPACCVVLCCVGMAAVLPWSSRPSSQAAMAVYLEQRTARGSMRSMSGCGCWIDAGAAVERVLRCASRQRAGSEQSISNQRAGAPLDYSCPTAYNSCCHCCHYCHTAAGPLANCTTCTTGRGVPAT